MKKDSLLHTFLFPPFKNARTGPVRWLSREGHSWRPSDLSSIPGTRMVEGENSSHKFSSDVRMHGVLPAWAASPEQCNQWKYKSEPKRAGAHMWSQHLAHSGVHEIGKLKSRSSTLTCCCWCCSWEDFQSCHRSCSAHHSRGALWTTCLYCPYPWNRDSQTLARWGLFIWWQGKH